MTSVACCQINVGPDPRENLRNVTYYIGLASSSGAAVVVFPEASTYANDGDDGGEPYIGESVDGAWVRTVREVAQKRGVHVIIGIREKRLDGGHPYNTLVHIKEDGDVESIYRKIHLYDAFSAHESNRISSGPTMNNRMIFEVDGVTFGACTCYDLRFPEIFRVLVDEGAQAFIVPAAWRVGPSKERQWEILLQARAIENTCYCIGCGRTGGICIGCSTIIDPMGVTIAGSGTEPCLVLGDVSLPEVRRVRAVNPSLANRRFGVAAV